MTSKEHLQHLMREIGPQLSLAAVTEYDEENLWVLTFDEATVIEADFDATFGKLVLASTIAPAMEGTEAQLYPLLLQFNYAWEQTGGARMALDGPGGSAVMVIDVPIGELDFQKLQTVLINLAAQVCHWRAVLQSMSITTPPPRAMETEGDSQFLGSSLRI